MQKQLILVMGCIDVLAYAAFCTGFAYCGGAVATLALAGGGQIFTALMSKYILKKQLSQGQVIGVRCLSRQLPQHIVPACVDWNRVLVDPFILSADYEPVACCSLPLVP